MKRNIPFATILSCALAVATPLAWTADTRIAFESCGLVHLGMTQQEIGADLRTELKNENLDADTKGCEHAPPILRNLPRRGDWLLRGRDRSDPVHRGLPVIAMAQRSLEP